MNNVWKLRDHNEDQVVFLTQQLGVSPTIATILVNRGWSHEKKARQFLTASVEQLSDPYVLSGMSAAVDRILSGLKAEEKIVIYGDYDVDGICSVVLLKDCFSRLNGSVDYYVPDRFNEGYGLNEEAVKKLADGGYTLLITVDCGISSVQEVELAQTLGMDVIITDHHTPPPVQPQAIAVINPKNDEIDELRDLAGVGVAFKLAVALMMRTDPKFDCNQWMDLVALATVADIVPLVFENRIMVKQGLLEIEKTPRLGLRALIKESGMEAREVKSWHIGFVLGPRLNSAGRMRTARMAIDLLLTTDTEEAIATARTLCELNEERKRVEKAIYEEALLQVEESPELKTAPVLLVGGRGWHEGVIGIVASRLADHYNKPTIVVSWDGDEGRGSARSTGDFDLYAALTYCSDCLNGYGGHLMAAGLNVKRELFARFYNKLQEYAESHCQPSEGKNVFIDMALSEYQLNLELVKDIQILEPFGEGNPVPLFLLPSVGLQHFTRVGGKKEHLKFKAGVKALDAILFNRPEVQEKSLAGSKNDLVFEIGVNAFRGKETLQLKIKDLKPVARDKPVEQKKQIKKLRPIFEKTENELEHNRPVLYLYPSYRSMCKHLPLLKRYFGNHPIQILSGHQYAGERKAGEEAFQKGGPKIFLSTQAYIQYYRRQFPLPDKLQVTALWWEQDLGQLACGSDFREMIRIDQGINPTYKRAEIESNSSHERTLIYANLPGTVKHLIQCYPRAQVEAGQKDPDKRTQLYRDFIDAPQGILIVDGDHPGEPRQMDKRASYLLADCPFGKYEMASLTDYLEEDETFQVGVAFDRESIEKNRRYLRKLYPDLSLIRAVIASFAKRGKNTYQDQIDQLVNQIKLDINRDFSSIELLSILHIMADLGLCRVQKRGSIIAIKFMPTENQRLNINDSPYFLEGVAEKRVFSEWEEEIKQWQIW